ncbi:HAD family hydrolase [uncultured Muribaculum sp.]|uniref:HAD family hydrolase n=1 Tax=uncultured Muribaculum sp. TaxID=1918613 RepID=UPI0025A9CD9D|nr:HAD family hydrolase [uncultured Muribaculum sp.]
MKKLVIFDLDGTLLNTIDDLGHATNYALEKMGYAPHPLNAYPAMVGNGVTKLLERALPAEVSTDPLQLQHTRSWFQQYYDLHSTDHSKPYDGITELLSTLAERNINMAVASNKYHDAVLQLVGHYFPTIPWVSVWGQKEDMPVKPDPSIVFGILNDCPTNKSDVLYVGDSGVDIKTARRACVESVGVTWGFRSKQELEEAYADHIVSEPHEILDYIG